ncbi:MAG: hypothetical protein QOH26_859, partial [Actinomycetota bacterium]|nr:hypothetical protein [Actinomycetota bacterium]
TLTITIPAARATAPSQGENEGED